MQLNKRIPLFLGGFIFSLGLFLRVFGLDRLPAGLHFDEAQAGYNAYLISETGKNIAGQFLPIFIDSWGDYRPALISYLTIIPVKLFGLNEFATRIPSTLAGSVLVILAFYFSNLCFKSRKIALLAGLLTAISPYGIITSRATSEGIIDVVFTLLATFLLIKGFKQNNWVWFILAYLFFSLGYFSYMTSRVLTPLFWGATVVLSYLKFKPGKKILFLSFLPIIAYLIFPWGYFFRTPIGQGRFKQVSVFTFPEVQRSLDEKIREDGNQNAVWVTRIFHNKLIAYTYDISERYLTFFSPALMLFTMRQPERYYISGVGPFLIIEFFGIITFISFLIAKARKFTPLAYLPIALFFLAPIPSSLTTEAFPNFSRIVFMVPLWQIVAAAGIYYFLKNLNNKKLAGAASLLFIVVTAWQFANFIHQYLVHEPRHYWSISTRATEMRETALFLKEQKDRGYKITLSEYDGGYIYYLFYNKINLFTIPYQKTNYYFNGDFSMDNIEFRKNPCLGALDIIEKTYDIVIIRNGCRQLLTGTEMRTIERSDGSPALIARFVTGDKTYLEFVNRYKKARSLEERLAISVEADNALYVKN